jgi:ubiquinone/menaquinone biosynthesis C-methylase UbiE
VNLSVRSYEKELLDRDDIPFADIAQNMKELDFINIHLGGHSITIKGFKKLLQDKKKISVCEIGCGGGDNLKAIAGYCKKTGIEVTLTGIDINEDCIAVAASQLKSLQPLLIHSDYSLVNFGTNKPHIIFSSLFCHHFKEPELATMLKWMKQNSTTGFFINDLHRHWLAYYSIKWLTALFSKSYLVKNDAPLSVKRGFKKKEWIQVLLNAGINDYTLKWKWAFRWLLVSPDNSMIN